MLSEPGLLLSKEGKLGEAGGSLWAGMLLRGMCRSLRNDAMHIVSQGW